MCSDEQAIEIAKAYYECPQSEAFYLEKGKGLFQEVMNGRRSMYGKTEGFDRIMIYLRESNMDFALNRIKV